MNKLLLTSAFCAATLLLSACNDSSGSSQNNNTNNNGTNLNGDSDPGGTGNNGGSTNSDDTTVTLPTFDNAANLRATPLANALLLEWDVVTNTDRAFLYYSTQAIDEANPASGSSSPPVNTCTESPCTISTSPGELTYIALLSEDASGQSLDFSQIVAASGQINDSGAIRCYAPRTSVAGGFDVADCSAAAVGTTQDAHVGRDANEPTKLGSGSGGFDFTKLDSSGQPITDGSAHTCVRDNLTGLTWEVKTTTNRDVRYVWGTGTGSFNTDVNTFVTQTNNTGLCGLTNWRLPTANELFGLVDFDKPHGITASASADGVIDQYLSIDRDFFPNTRMVNQYLNTHTRVRHAHYWTSDTYQDEYDDTNYTLVDFFRGSLVNTSNPRANFVLFNVIHDGAFARLVSNGLEGVQP